MQIQIPEPCQESWYAMEGSANGIGYCNKCAEHIVDLSNLNDEQLINYFKENPFTNCARFASHQLQREIPTSKPAMKNYLFANKYNLAASIVFLLYQIVLVGCKTINTKREIKFHIVDGNYEDLKNEEVDLQLYGDTINNYINNYKDKTDSNGILNITKINDSAKYLVLSINNKQIEKEIDQFSGKFLEINTDTLPNSSYRMGKPQRVFAEKIYNINFENNSAHLTKESKSDLEKLFKALQSNKKEEVDAKINYSDSSYSKILVMQRKKVLTEMAKSYEINTNQFEVLPINIDINLYNEFLTEVNTDSLLHSVKIFSRKNRIH